MAEERSPFWQAVGLAWELGYTITIPLVLLALVGRMLDRKFDTSPWLLLAGILLSIVVSSIGVMRKVTHVMRASAAMDPRDAKLRSEERRERETDLQRPSTAASNESEGLPVREADSVRSQDGQQRAI